MKMKPVALSAAAALALAVLFSRPSAAAVDPALRITIPGTVVSSSHDHLVIRTDDHAHHMAFDVASGASLPDGGLRKGTHVSVTYHPLGITGQAVDEIRLLEPHAFARSQASFKVVTGPEGETRVTAR